MSKVSFALKRWGTGGWTNAGKKNALKKMLGVASDSTASLASRMTAAPSMTRLQLMDNLVASLTDGGVWSKLDGLWILAAHDAQAARLNWKSTSFNLTEVASPTFTADRGYAGNGTSSYLTTGYTLGTSGSFAQNNHSFGIWVNNTITDGTSFCEMGVTNTQIISRTAGGNINIRSAASTSDSTAVASALGHVSVSRAASGSFAAYKDGVSIGPFTRTSATPTAQPVYIGARNNAGIADQFSNRRIAAAYIGVSLTAGEGTTLHTALNTYLSAVGGA